MSFEKLGLKKEIIKVISSLKFKEPMDVQKKIIPLTLQKKNVVFTSATGSGKTLAYSIGVLSRLNKKLGLQMIVLTPTRELCIQVGKELTKICQPLLINVGTLYGGRDVKGDYKTTNKKNQIMVATPGRLIQHVNDKIIKVGEVKYLVYDESDQMFDNGFYSDCAYLKTRVSKDAQIVLASATMTDKVKEFIESKIKNYELINIGTQIPKNITQEKIYCTIPEKNEILFKYIKNKLFKQIIIFCNKKSRCREITEFLTEHKLRAKTLTGDLEQKERTDLMNLFRNLKFNILVTTDVAARGLHIEKVEYIINYDVPTRTEFYVHRIGRTGRVDKTGNAITFICPEDENRFEMIESTYELDIKKKEI